jgi:hypothetical protein
VSSLSTVSAHFDIPSAGMYTIAFTAVSGTTSLNGIAKNKNNVKGKKEKRKE